MASVLYLALLLSLSCVLWSGADAGCGPPSPPTPAGNPSPPSTPSPPRPPSPPSTPSPPRPPSPPSTPSPPRPPSPPSTRSPPRPPSTRPRRPPSPPGPSCPSGWIKYENRCFFFNGATADWATAERACIGYGGNLASIHSTNEHSFLKELVKSRLGSYERTWVGGHDAVKEGVWLWSDGSRFSFTQWGTGEPNNVGGNEHCMEINLGGSPLYLNDEPCTRSNYYICAKRL